MTKFSTFALFFPCVVLVGIAAWFLQIAKTNTGSITTPDFKFSWNILQDIKRLWSLSGGLTKVAIDILSYFYWAILAIMILLLFSIFIDEGSVHASTRIMSIIIGASLIFLIITLVRLYTENARDNIKKPVIIATVAAGLASVCLFGLDLFAPTPKGGQTIRYLF